jgi:hypothetical protein
MPVQRRAYIPKPEELKYSSLEEAEYLDHEKEEHDKKISIEIDISRLKTEIREVVCNLDDPFFLEEILAYSRHLFRQFVTGEDADPDEALCVGYNFVEPEVDEPGSGGE